LYDITTDKAGLAWKDPDGNCGSGGDLVIEGQRYLPSLPNSMMKNGVINFPSAMGEKKSIRELLTYIEGYLRSIYLMPSDKMARLISYWILSTWIYDCFETVIYLRAIGGAGSGKSELMKRIGMLCYRNMSASGAASTPSLFRAVERWKGTVFIDEADLQQGGDTTDDMVKFYNSGAMKDGGGVWRSQEMNGPNGEKDWDISSFQTFCPKMIAMRRDFKDDAVGTRSITLNLVPRETIELLEADIPLSINNEIRARAQAYRNLLLRWRLETWQEEILVDPSFYDKTISARLNQVAGAMLAIAYNDAEQQEDIRRTLREYYAETIMNQSLGMGARVLEALWKIWKYPDLHAKIQTHDDGRFKIKIGDITRITNDIINEMNDSDEDEGDDHKPMREVKSQRIGSIIRKELMFEMLPRERDGFKMVWNEPRMKGLSNKYGINPEDFGPPAEAEKPVQPVKAVQERLA
jgi:hypothetical protein